MQTAKRLESAIQKSNMVVQKRKSGSVYPQRLIEKSDVCKSVCMFGHAPIIYVQKHDQKIPWYFGIWTIIVPVYVNFSAIVYIRVPQYNNLMPSQNI